MSGQNKLFRWLNLARVVLAQQQKLLLFAQPVDVIKQVVNLGRTEVVSLNRTRVVSLHRTALVSLNRIQVVNLTGFSSLAATTLHLT